MRSPLTTWKTGFLTYVQQFCSSYVPLIDCSFLRSETNIKLIERMQEFKTPVRQMSCPEKSSLPRRPAPMPPSPSRSSSVTQVLHSTPLPLARAKLSENIPEETTLSHYEREMKDIIEELRMRNFDSGDDEDDEDEDVVARLWCRQKSLSKLRTFGIYLSSKVSNECSKALTWEPYIFITRNLYSIRINVRSNRGDSSHISYSL